MSENTFYSQRESFREALNIKNWKMTGAYDSPAEAYEEKDDELIQTEDKILIEFTHRDFPKYRVRVISVAEDRDEFEVVFDDDGETELFAGEYLEVKKEALQWMSKKNN